jgi:hypothetical protein
MGALSIAFDIIIVGALALPGVLLVIHLFFSDDEKTLKKLLVWVKEQNQPALAGVLLFAMTYALGSAASRIAQDFFDDDDLHIHVFHRLFRVGVTESSIRTDVFCNALRDQVAPGASDPLTEKHEPIRTADPKPSDPLTDKKRETFRTNDPECHYTGRWIVQTRDPDTHQTIIVGTPGQRLTADWINKQEDLASYVFHVDEAAVLLKGIDPTERLRQYHDQIMVLRGAAFNALVALTLCLFWWSAQFHPGLGWALSSFYALLGFIALYHHFQQSQLSNPPYMEFTLFVLAAAGWYLLWRHAAKRKRGHEKSGAHNEPKPIPSAYLVLAAFLYVTASLGWWATQVLYDQQVVYSYKALSADTAKDSTK